MSEASILAQRNGAVFVITLNRPDRRNAVTLAMMNAVAQVMADAAADAKVRAVVLTGGPDCFSSGMDLHEARTMQSAEDVLRGSASWQKLNGALESSRLPVFAAIEGACMTGGCELALACDVRIAGQGSTFGITSARIGTVPGAGATQRLPRLVGMGHALQLMLVAEPIDVADALRIGLVNEVTPRGGAMHRTMALAKLAAQRAPLSLGAIKRAVREGVQLPLTQAIELEAKLGGPLVTSADREEGLSAFLEKRPATFTGR